MTRTIQLAYATRFPRRAVPGMAFLDESVTRMRVHPGDLDLYRHVNNGVYLQMMDVARINLIADMGLARELIQRGWYPVVAASTMSYKRSLTLGQRFEVRSRVLGWDARCAYLEQRFVRDGDQIARGIVAGRFLTTSGERLDPTQILELTGHPVESPELPDDVAAWAQAFDVAFRAR